MSGPQRILVLARTVSTLGNFAAPVALSFAGPALGGLLATTAGPGWALAANAASYVIAAVLISPPRTPKDSQSGG